MRITILPKSLLGRWSVGLVAAFILLLVLLIVLGAYLGVAVGEGSFQSLAGILGTAVGISGIGALVIGLISMIKSRERSILVFLVVIVGFLVLLMEFLEFLLSH